MFCSDYPHVEGGRNPLKRFDAALAGIADAGRRALLLDDNFLDLMGRIVAMTVTDLRHRPRVPRRRQPRRRDRGVVGAVRRSGDPRSRPRRSTSARAVASCPQGAAAGASAAPRRRAGAARRRHGHVAKGWAALGAFDTAERSRALDLLGFHRQLVFSTFAPTQFEGDRDLDLLYGGASALTRAMADFCADDDRLMPVATLPMSDPARSVAALQEAIDARLPARC